MTEMTKEQQDYNDFLAEFKGYTDIELAQITHHELGLALEKVQAGEKINAKDLIFMVGTVKETLLRAETNELNKATLELGNLIVEDAKNG